MLLGEDARAAAAAADAAVEATRRALGGEVKMLERYVFGAGPRSPSARGVRTPGGLARAGSFSARRASVPAATPPTTATSVA